MGLFGDIIIQLQNNEVTSLDFRWNNIGFEGAKHLGEALKSNTSLRSLDLDSNNIGVENKSVIDSFIERNVNIKKRVYEIVIRLICARKLDNQCNLCILPKEILLMIAKCVWKTRTDFDWINIKKIK